MINLEFEKIFGASPAQISNAPGRVNLIGEHIDYNGGTVLPMALPIGLEVALAPRRDELIRIASDKFDGIEERRLGEVKTGGWADYAVGAIEFAVRAEYLQRGVDLYISSMIPDGAGLSSSAALIVAILKAARQQSERDVTDADIAVLARQVENEYIGMPCGIMDQMAVAVSQPGEAIALDTTTLDYDLVSLPDRYHFVVLHSGQHRKLSDGRYRKRTLECEEAKKAAKRDDLCLLSECEIAKLDVAQNIRKRAFHCITEHARVLAAIEALRKDDMNAFGALMNESHYSMRDYFEISTPEINVLVADAVKYGAIGARLTGGGFGGCVVCAVDAELADAWKATLLAHHPNAKFIC